MEGTAWGLSNYADILLNALETPHSCPGDRERLLTLHDEILPMMQAIGDAEGLTYTQVGRGITRLLVLKDCAGAQNDLQDALARAREMEGNSVAVEPVEAAANYAEVCGDLITAVVLQGAVEAIMMTQGTQPTPNETRRRQEDLDVIKSRMNAETFETAFTRGHTLTVSEALHLACRAVGIPD